MFWLESPTDGLFSTHYALWTFVRQFQKTGYTLQNENRTVWLESAIADSEANLVGELIL